MKLEEAYNLLRHGYESGKLAQAYIVVGSVRGNGCEVVDRMLELLLCTEASHGCGECGGCRSGREHTHPDLTWVEPQKKSRSISIDQVRDLQRRIFQTSFAGGWKVCVVAAADRLGLEASNAFLKILEEPPGRTVFFLITDSPQSLLPTIVSRCQGFVVGGEQESLPDDWRNMLFSILGALGARDVTVSLGLAARLGGLLELMKRAALEEVTAAAGESTLDEDDDTLEARASARYRELRSCLFRHMLLWYRDILILICGADEKVVVNQDCLPSIQARARVLDQRKAQRSIATIEQMYRQMERNVPEALALNAGFGRLL